MDGELNKDLLNQPGPTSEPSRPPDIIHMIEAPRPARTSASVFMNTTTCCCTVQHIMHSFSVHNGIAANTTPRTKWIYCTPGNKASSC